MALSKAKAVVPQTFNLTRHGDHNWKIVYNNGTMLSITLRDYSLSEIRKYPNINSDTFYIETTEDGLYIAEVLADDNTTHYVEIYDFTDTEECYLKLMRNVLCECLDCDDCPGENYTRALTFANLYLLVRDIAYADRWSSGGFTNTETLRTERVADYGVIVEKLKMMVSKCTCND